MANLRGQAKGAVAHTVLRIADEATLESAESIAIDVYDIIGDFLDGTVVARDVLGKLRTAKSAKTINVRINSAGGIVDDAVAIYNLLHQSKARVIVDIDAYAASAATIIAMAGDEIRMAENALMMIHNPWTLAVGDARDMRASADVLDKMRDLLVTTYAARTKLSREQLVQMLDDETWMTAEEAFSLGFATHITPAKQAAAMLKSEIDISRFRRPKESADSLNELHERVAAILRDWSPPKPNEPPPAAAAPAAVHVPPPVMPEPVKQPKDEDTMSNLHPSIAQALGLPIGAPESDVIAACARLRELEVQVVACTGCASSAEAGGALRGIKAKADESDKLRKENAELKGERDKQNFETQIQRGKAERKLNDPLVAMYREEFERASAEGNGANVVARVKGHVDVGPTLIAEPLRQPAPSGSGTTPLAWNGKKFSELRPMEMHQLWQENAELYQLMKRDHEASNPL